MKPQSEHPLFAEERKGQILELLRQKSKLLVPELCDYFDVSPATIRNDLRDLENERKLKRTHGGAISLEKTSFELDSRHKEIRNMEQKRQIAACAATLIEDGDTIILDTGTTTLELAKCLSGKRDLTIVLNDIEIASLLEESTQANLILIGGTLRHGFHCTVGPMAVSYLSELNVDKVFLSSNAVSLDRGFTTPDFNQAEVKKTMIQVASEVIMLSDSSKFGKLSFTQFAALSDIDKLITDKGIDPQAAEQLRQLESFDLVIA